MCDCFFCDGDSMLFKGLVEGKQALILLDTGANANVIGEDLLQQLDVTDISFDEPTLNIELADPSITQSSSIIAWVRVTIEEYSQVIPFYVFDVGKQCILGIPFWKSINANVDWRDRKLNFQSIVNEVISEDVHYWTGASISEQISFLNKKSKQPSRPQGSPVALRNSSPWSRGQSNGDWTS